MRTRRAFIGAAGLALLGTPLAALAQRPLPRIGALAAGPNPREAAFWQGMRDLGYIEGKTIVVDRRSAEGDLARLPALAAEMVKSRPDVIVAFVSAAAVAAKQATSTIPIVITGSADPVAAGLARSPARPGGNVTGLSSQSASAIAKLLELVRQLFPNATRIGALWDPVNATSQQIRLGETLIAAARLQMLVRIHEVHSRDDLERAFAALNANRPDAVLVASDTFFFANAGRIVELGLAHRLPILSTGRPLVEAGILAAYGADVTVLARRAATYVQKILNGAKPGDMPIELPSKFELVINLRTASSIGITVPPSVLARADEVIR